MSTSLRTVFAIAGVAIALISGTGTAQQTRAATPPAPVWRDSARYGGGPSVGAPPSDFSGAKPPERWCLQTNARAPGDFGLVGHGWMDATRSWMRDVLSDTTEHGDGWRRVLGGAPRLTPSDSIIQLLDEDACREIAQVLNREVLGWEVGPPPVVVFQVRDYLIAHPSNARRGEWGLAVGMTMQRQVRGVALW